MRIEELDQNFTTAKIGDYDFVFCEPIQAPFEINGLAWFKHERLFCRLPQADLAKLSAGVQSLAWHTAGAQVRFRSNSRRLAVKVQLLGPSNMSHLPATGQSGLDLYLGTGKDKYFLKTAVPPAHADQYQLLLFDHPQSSEREFTLNLPLYNGLRKLEIAICPGAQISPPTPFAISRPVLFYGSSITQGGCASRPGNCYPQILARHLDFEGLNLGFSGNARGELILADIISRLDLAAFVLDYDHNAPNPEHLEKTHQNFFLHIREKRPELPIIIVSRPDFDLQPENSIRRRDIILRTYLNARERGDNEVYFVDGETLFGRTDRDACTVDGCHPNDLGFMRMAEAIQPALTAALKIKSPNASCPP